MRVGSTLVFLADFSFSNGLIGIDEHWERMAIARWIDDDDREDDPRGFVERNERRERGEGARQQTNDGGVRQPLPSSPSTDTTMHLVALNVWFFTRSDPDPYPSVPHGHFQSAMRSWPKLNPYTGRVYSAKEREDPSMRLDKKDMRTLWRDPTFQDYCRAHIMGYMQNHPHFRFAVRHPQRLPRW